MDITPLMRPDQKIIQSYGAGFFRVNGEIFHCPVLVFGDRVQPWACGDNPLVLSADMLTQCAGADILLIGVGVQSRPIPPSQRAAFSGLGLTVDVMDTPAACRTFNVLTAEDRKVAVALLPV